MNNVVVVTNGVQVTTEVVRPALVKTVMRCCRCGWQKEHVSEQVQGVAWGNVIMECPDCGPQQRAEEMVKALRENRDGVRVLFDALMRG